MKILLLFFIFLFFTFQTKSQLFIGQTQVDTTTVISGLDIPWEILWGPDDMIWVTERFGRIGRVHPETGSHDIILDISGIVYQSGESGLLGMVLHPDFELNPIVYIAYTYNSGGSIFERIASYNFTGGQLVNESVLLDSIPASSNHDGCRLIISPGYKLFITTGDATDQSSAQDTAVLSGKVLRINLDGTIPADNPFSGSPVYSFGHRNPQGLFYGPNGILYSSEHGPSNDDEFNIIEAGRNYGWPDVRGFCDLPAEITFCAANDVVEPLQAWTPTIATSDIVYYNHPAIPEWQDHILLTTLKNKRLYVLELDETGTMVLGENQYFQDFWGRLRDVCIGPNGEIYLATNGASWSNTQPFTHKIIKVWNPGIRLNIKAFLEGPFDFSSNEMKTDLNSVIPNIQPFGPTLPYFNNPLPDWYYTGSENVSAVPNPDIVDWVLIELRDAQNVSSALPGTMISRQAAFITKTGQVVDLDGYSYLNFYVNISNNLYVVIRSRNHIGVISANPISESNGLYSYDFSTGPGQAWGLNSQKELYPGSGIWGLFSGDGDGDGLADVPDKSSVWDLQTGNAGYLESDYNMNGRAENTDKNDHWLPNLGLGSYIPE